MAEAPFSDEDSGRSVKYFSSSSSGTAGLDQPDDEDNLVPSENGPKANGNSVYTKQIENQITQSLDKLSTKSDQNSDSDESDEQFRKKVRVGNHYQARIPKYHSDQGDHSYKDERLWNPYGIDSGSVDKFLQRIASIRKLLIPLGNHLRDDEEALYALQKNGYDVENTVQYLSANRKDQTNVWSDEECRNFEKGLLNFGKNFFLIQKYRVTTRNVGELVQFYYLWKKTERYDLYASRIRTGKKKYALNPGVSELMCRYIGRQIANIETVRTDVQFIVTDTRKDVSQKNSQY